MSEKGFLVTGVGAELPEFARPTYCIFLPDEKLLADENVQSAFAKLAPLVHAGEPQIRLEVIASEKLKFKKTELTCMDAREFTPASRTKLLGEQFLTFAGSGLFLHPEISAKLRAAGHGDLVDALAAILRAAAEKGIRVDIFSNHFGADGGCGGLNFVKTVDPNFRIPDAENYKKLFVETRAAVSEIADDAQLIMHETGADGVIVRSFELENADDFAAFAAKYDGKF